MLMKHEFSDNIWIEPPLTNTHAFSYRKYEKKNDDNMQSSTILVIPRNVLL